MEVLQTLKSVAVKSAIGTLQKQSTLLYQPPMYQHISQHVLFAFTWIADNIPVRLPSRPDPRAPIREEDILKEPLYDFLKVLLELFRQHRIEPRKLEEQIPNFAPQSVLVLLSSLAYTRTEQ